MTEKALLQRLTNVYAIAERRRQQTHCKRGHLFSKDNLAKTNNGRRRCRTCDRDRKRYNSLGLSIRDFD